MSVSYRNNTTGLLERAAGYSDTDAVLSPISRNPIQNKAVYDALAQKIEKTVADLENYYNTSQTYNKQEVRELIGSINTLTIEVVATLPTEDISSTTIYFVGPKAGSSTYDEYVYVNNAWVQIGDTEIDLSNYVTSADLTTALQSYYTKTQTDNLFNDYYNKDAVDDLLDTKQNTLDFDNTPIAGSSNPVTSAGIKTALDNILISGNGGSIIKVHHTAGAAAAGNTVTASKGSYSVSSTFDVSGDAIIIGFGEIGNITITATNGSESGSIIINIPNFSVYTARVSYGLDYKSWLIEGGVDPSYYSSLDEVLEDEEVIRRLMTIHASVDYLATLNNAADEMVVTVLNNDICAKWINLRDYALDTLYANEYTKAIMDEADKYGYGEWVIVDDTTTPPTWGAKGCVPVMTSNTAPYGEASASNELSGYNAYKAFDKVDTSVNSWFINTTGNNALPSDTHIKYKFTNPVLAKKAFIRWYDIYPSGMTATIKIQGSNDANTWNDVSEEITFSNGEAKEVELTSSEYYLYYKLLIVSQTGININYYYGGVNTLQFYGRQFTVSVPTMTSNNEPYGVAFATAADSTAYYVFKKTLWLPSAYSNVGVGYEFKEPVKVNAVSINQQLAEGYGRLKEFKIQASNDRTDWVDLTETLTLPNTNGLKTFIFSNPNSYKAYRLFIFNAWSSAYYVGTNILNFYGVDYSEKEFEAGTTKKYLYDHGVELETIEAIGTGTATKESSQLVIESTGNNNIEFVLSNALDFTGYSILREKVGDKFVNSSGGGNCAINVRTQKSATASAIASVSLTQANLPNNVSLNVGAINQSVYPSIVTGGGSGYKHSCSELWLE